MWRMKDKTLTGVEAEKLKKNFGVYAILLTALAAMTFFGVCDPTAQMRGPQGSAATVDGEVISRAEFNRAYRSRYDQYQRMYGEAFDPSALNLAATVINELVDNRAMYMKAVDLGMRASDEEVYAVLLQADGFKDDKGQFSEEVFDNFLRNNGFTEASFMNEVRRDLTLDKMRRFVSETAYVSTKAAELDFRLAETKLDVEYLKLDPQKIDVKVSDEDVTKYLAVADNKAKVKEYYDGNTREFNQPEQVKARHILVGYKGSRNATPDAAKREKDAAKARATELLAKVKAPGADFAAIAKADTDEAAGKTSGGDLGWFTRDAMDKAFSDAAFAMNAGAISDVIETPFGFHIIKVEEKKAAVSTPLADAEKKIANNLLAKEKRPALAKERADKLLADLKAGTPIDGLLKEWQLAWAATGDVGADARFLPGIGSSKEVGDALSSLTKPGELFGAPVDVRGNLFILRLKSKKEPDMAKLDKDKRRQMAMTSAYSEGTALYTMYEKQVKDELEKKNKVRRNADYLALDQRTAPKDQAEN